MGTKLLRTYSLTVLLLGAGCGNSDYSMLNGASTQEVQETGEYPAVVLIALPDIGICSGTFVSPRAVITASHCTTQAGSYSVYSAFGRYSTSTVEKLGPGVVNDPNDLSLLLFGRDIADPAQGHVYGIGELPAKGEEVRLVGYGCNDLDEKSGAGVKRTGTNKLFHIGDYLELLSTPNERLKRSHASNALVGSDNQAGACFGDSGGPMLQKQNNSWKVVGITHAGGWSDAWIRSQFVNLNRSENLAFLQDADRDHDLHLFDGCWTDSDPEACGPTGADLTIFGFLKPLIAWLLNLFW